MIKISTMKICVEVNQLYLKKKIKKARIENIQISYSLLNINS